MAEMARHFVCSWTSSLEHSADGPLTAARLILPLSFLRGGCGGTCHFRRSPKTILFGLQWDRSAVWTLYTFECTFGTRSLTYLLKHPCATASRRLLAGSCIAVTQGEQKIANTGLWVTAHMTFNLKPAANGSWRPSRLQRLMNAARFR